MSRFTEYQPENNRLGPVAGYWTWKVVSLEEALTPFFDQFDGLQRSIQEVKKFCHYPSVHNVTRDESAALMLYTMETGDQSFYYKVNEALRKENRKELIPWFPYLKFFDSMLSKMPIVKGIIWRGVRGDVTESLKVGETITWWSISSCSTSSEVVEKFLNKDSKSTLFMIEAKTGKNVAAYSMFPDEKEVILGIGTQLRVKCIEFLHDNLLRVHLEEVEPNFDNHMVPSATDSKTEEPIPNQPTNPNGGKLNVPPIEIKFGGGSQEINVPNGPPKNSGISINSDKFSIWWLDANVDSDGNRNTQKQLHTISEYFQVFKSETHFLQSIKSMSNDDHVLLIVSGGLGCRIVPQVHSCRQVTSIYVYCVNKKHNEQWASKYSKIKGVFTRPDELIAHIQKDREDFIKPEEPLPGSSFNLNGQTDSKFSRFDGEFLHFQLLIEVLLHMKQHKKDRKELVSMLKKEFRKNETALKVVEEFNANYTPEKAIWWYVQENFISQSLNEAFRTRNIDMLVAFRSFIIDIYRQLIDNHCDGSIRTYRGQKISRHELNNYQSSIDQLISINSFLSTCSDEDHANRFIQQFNNTSVSKKTKLNDDSVPVLFRIDANPQDTGNGTKRPFADISLLNAVETKKEILFMVGSIFRLKSVKIPDHKSNLSDGQNVTIIEMELCEHKQYALGELYDYMVNDYNKPSTNFISLGKVLIKMGKVDLAEKYVSRMLDELPSNDPLVGDAYFTLGHVADYKGDFDKSIALYEKSLAIKNQVGSTDHVSICNLHNSIGVAYQKKKDIKRALESFNKAVSLLKQARAKNHPLMASLYHNIGLINYQNNYLDKALEYYQKSLTIKEKLLPEGHSSFADSYNNIGIIYHCRNLYDTALSYYKRSLKIKLNILPSTHPDIARLYKNIGVISEEKGDYEEALTNFKSAKNIYKQVLPSDHPDISAIKKDINRVSKQLKLIKEHK